MTSARDMIEIPGGMVELGLTPAEADRLARELTEMEQTLLEERQHLDGYHFDFDETLQRRRAWLETSVPVHEVEVVAFAIDRYPVTVRQYAKYVARTGAAEPARLGYRRHAEEVFVTGVSWREASAYAEHHGLALPSEAQWELATRRDRRFFPWGDAYFPLGRIAYPEDGADVAWAVGSRPQLASPFGVHDLIGEFGEYTRDPFQPYPGTDQALFEAHFPRWREERATRGGYDVYQDSTSVYRNGIAEDLRAHHMKFRCVRG